MSFNEECKKKLVTADEVVKVVNSGDIVDYGFCNGKPVVLDKALAARAEELRDVSVYTAVTVPPLPEVVNHPESFCYIDWHWSKLTRMIHGFVNPAYYCPIL